MKKITKKSNKKDPETEKEIKYYLGALAETYNENLKTIKEGSIVTNRKLGNIEKILDSHTEMIGTLMEDVSILKNDMQIVKKEIKRKVDYDEFILLVERVNKLESKT